MAEQTGEDTALMLLRVLPADVAEGVLGRLGPDPAARLRKRLRAAPAEPPPPEELDAALAQFFDLQRIARRTAPPTQEQIAAAAVAAAGGTGAAPGAASGAQSNGTGTAAGAAGTPAANPIDELKAIPADQLARAMEGEQAGSIALVLTCLDPATQGQVIRRLPPDLRPEIALRLTKPGARNLALLQPLAQALVEKTRKLKDVPSEPTQEELIMNLADMLRTFPRGDRMPVVAKLEATDPELAARVVENLYRMDDLLRIPDRQIQMLLGKLDVKTVAVALKGAIPAIRTKITNNMSSRSKSVLEEESELLGSIPDSVVKDAQKTVLAAVRKGEEDGQITMD